MGKENKAIALVTGADGGMGRIHVRELAKAGYEVIMACIDTAVVALVDEQSQHHALLFRKIKARGNMFYIATCFTIELRRQLGVFRQIYDVFDGRKQVQLTSTLFFALGFHNQLLFLFSTAKIQKGCAISRHTIMRRCEKDNYLINRFKNIYHATGDLGQQFH